MYAFATATDPDLGAMCVVTFDGEYITRFSGATEGHAEKLAIRAMREQSPGYVAS